MKGMCGMLVYWIINRFKQAIRSALIIALLFSTCYIEAQTVGVLISEEKAFDGYTLFAPSGTKITYLIDNAGRVLNTWQSQYTPGHTVYLANDGSLYRAGQLVDEAYLNGSGGGGIIERFGWSGEIIWSYKYSDTTKRHHHDFEVLPNENVLILAWELITTEEAIKAGRNPDLIPFGALWPDHIVEIDPSTDEIVWEWHVFDHIIQDFDETKDNYGNVSESPGLIDINYIISPVPDWNHCNSIDYNESLDQIMLSSRSFGEIWVLDHSTSTQEAKGHTGGKSGKGGDLIYRWGNPRAYQRGELGDQRFFGQHDAHWIPADLPEGGKIMVFNNGRGRPGLEFSTVEILNPDIDSNGNYKIDPITGTFEPGEVEYKYASANPVDLFAELFSGAQQLPNNTIFVCDGPQGIFFEVDQKSNIVWKYVNPVTPKGIINQGEPMPRATVFRAIKYAKSHPAFENKELVPGSTIEGSELILGREEFEGGGFLLYPNPADNKLSLKTFLSAGNRKFQVFNYLGELILDGPIHRAKIEIDTDLWPSGVYFVRVQEVTKRIHIAH